MSWRSADDRPRESAGREVKAELEAILESRTGVSNRFLVLCDWLLDLSTRPAGRVVVAIAAVSAAAALL